MKLSVKLIKSFIPKSEFYNGSKLKGISLIENSYDLFYSNYDNTFIFRTSISNPLIKILSEHFDVIYKRYYYAHYHEFVIKEKL